MEVKVMSKEYIKPISPTPPRLKTHQLSVLDQLNSHAYIPFLLLYQNKMDTKDEIPQKLHQLKQGLSQTLSHFYPLAGELKENHQEIDCNDNGVYYVQTKVNIPILDFLKNPHTKLLHKLLAYSPSNKILLTKTCITMVQVNQFSCGGLVIGLYTSHKLVDGFSASLFWKSWAAAAKGISCKEFPKFDMHEMFPPNPTLPKHASLVMWPTLMGKCKCVARHFVFESSAISELKKKVTMLKNNPSRVVVVIGFIWKRLMAASKSRSGVHKPSVLTISVNLRGKTSPPSFNSFGNMLWFAVARYDPIFFDVGVFQKSQVTERDIELNSVVGCLQDAILEIDSDFVEADPKSFDVGVFQKSQVTNKDVELSSVVGCLHDAISEIDSDFVEELRGEKGLVNVMKHMEILKSAYSENDEEADYVVATSLCNAGWYEVDFGWGKPTWACHGGVDADCPALTNLIVLEDTKTGGGIEVQLSLDEGLMCILENDHEMLSFGTINHCPL